MYPAHAPCPRDAGRLIDWPPLAAVVPPAVDYAPGLAVRGGFSPRPGRPASYPPQLTVPGWVTSHPAPAGFHASLTDYLPERKLREGFLDKQSSAPPSDGASSRG